MDERPAQRTSPEVHGGRGRSLPFVEMRDSGVLWLINRVVFHPRGFALALDLDEDTGEVHGWEILGGGDSPWSFEDEVDDRRFAQVECFLDSYRRQS